MKLVKNYILENDIKTITPFIDKMCTIVKDNLKTEEEMELFATALYEVLMNAIEHGNLQILYKTKKEWLKKGVYKEKMSKLLKSDIAKNTKVYIELNIEDNTISIKVQDEGLGFDPENQLKDLIKDGFARENGRGMIIIKSYFDEVKYNKKGNVITLIKRKKASKPS